MNLIDLKTNFGENKAFFKYFGSNVTKHIELSFFVKILLKRR